MAETLTYDAATDVTTVENLNADEQDSLKVGEQMETEQEQLLAGKYKNAEELEQAYIELQKKLGTPEEATEETTTEASEEGEVEAKTEDEPEQDLGDYSFLDTLWDEYQTDELSRDTVNKLKDINPAEMADMYVAYRKEVEKQKPQVLNEQDVTKLKDIAGGPAEYENMLQWAQGNLDKQEIDMFDSVMDRGDPMGAFFAIRSLAYRYQDAVGVQKDLVTGKAARQDGNQFRSQAEVVAAMSDPRYEDDPAYRQDIMRKLDRSKDVKF